MKFYIAFFLLLDLIGLPFVIFDPRVEHKGVILAFGLLFQVLLILSIYYEDRIVGLKRKLEKIELLKSLTGGK